MLETVFYLQVFAFFILLLYAIWSRSSSVFALAGVFSILTGVMLAAGEPVEFFTGGYTLVESPADTFTATPNLETLTISNSPPINMWHFVLLYGGFVWIVVAIALVWKGRSGVGVEED